MDSLGALVPFIVILAAFWLLIIRPARSKARVQSRLQNELAVGQQVMMTSGLYGEVAGIEDDAVVIETSPGVTMRWAKPAVARILTPRDATSGDDGVAEHTDDAELAGGTTEGDRAAPEGTAGTESTEQR